jgi:hypothetical protein
VFVSSSKQAVLSTCDREDDRSGVRARSGLLVSRCDLGPAGGIKSSEGRKLRYLPSGAVTLTYLMKPLILANGARAIY